MTAVVEFLIPGRSPLTGQRYPKCRWYLPNVCDGQASIDLAQWLEEVARLSRQRIDAPDEGAE